MDTINVIFPSVLEHESAAYGGSTTLNQAWDVPTVCQRWELATTKAARDLIQVLANALPRK